MALPRSPYLEGVISLQYYRNIEGKEIVLLGEYHNQQYSCHSFVPDEDTITTYQFIDKYIQKKEEERECSDIFIEEFTPEQNKSSLSTESTLSSFMTFSIEYFEKMKKEDRYRNTRFHYVDLRPNSEVSIFFEFLEYFTNITTNDVVKVEAIEFYNVIIDFLCGIYNPSVFSSTIKKHRLYRAALRQVYEQSKKKEEDVLRELRRIRTKIMKEISKSIFKDDVATFVGVVKTESFPYNATTIIMDVYFLARLFIQFENRNTQSRICNEQRTPKNCIVYTGEFHTNIYSRFFLIYFGIVPDIMIATPMDDMYGCMRLPENVREIINL